MIKKTKMIVRILFFVFITLSSEQIYSQMNDSVQIKYLTLINRFNDSCNNSNRLYNDTIIIYLDSAILSSNSEIEFYYDSLLKSNEKFLKNLQKDSLKLFKKYYQDSIITLYDYFTKEIKLYSNTYDITFNNLSAEYKICEECENSEDILDQYEEYSDMVDSISTTYFDSVEVLYDSAEQRIYQLSESCIDFFFDYIDNIENEGDMYTADTNITESNDDPENENQVILNLDYLHNYHYSGRDENIKQRYLDFSSTIKLKNGLYFGADIYFLSKSEKKPEGVDISVGYEYNHDIYDFDISFTRSISSNDSVSRKSFLPNMFELTGGINSKNIVFTTTADIYFGNNQSEISIIFDLSGEFFIAGTELFDLTIEPLIYCEFGNQTSFNFGIRKKKIAIAKKKVFSVLDYEFHLPFNFEFDNFIITPNFQYIIPQNIIDDSSSNPFFNFQMNVTVPFDF